MNHVDELLAQARQQTNLSNFGSDEFREGLDILVNALDREARLNDTGRMGNDAQIVMLLANRLQVEDWYARHPEIDEQEIVVPLIGLGLPRTGSSALGVLLGEDPAVRSLRNWETMWPCPPPETATLANDPRIAMAESSMARRGVMFPRMELMLPSTATSPMECQLFMAMDFKSQIFQAFVHIPSYVEWFIHKADLVPTYRYVKRVLKLLQWRCPPNLWRLRNPSHSLFINALDEVFPDARFVMTHRDVGAVIPSVADLYYELRKAFSDDVDMVAIGTETSSVFELGMHRMIAFRDAGNENRFFDIQFSAFQKNPFPCIEALYAFLGETLSPQARANMEKWWQAQVPEQRRYERTDPSVFGLNPERLRAQFRFYAERFNVSEAVAS
jgi:hypothetical protein